VVILLSCPYSDSKALTSERHRYSLSLTVACPTIPTVPSVTISVGFVVGVASRAMRLRPITIRTATKVDSVSNRLNVVRVPTPSIVASVVEFEAGRHRSVPQYVGQHMCPLSTPLEVDGGIPLTIVGRPLPAIVVMP